MKQKLTLLLVVIVLIAKAQIYGSLNLNTAPKETFIGEFSGFCDGINLDSRNYSINVEWGGSCPACDGAVDNRFIGLDGSLNPTLHRFAGGEQANYYHRYLSNLGQDNINNVNYQFINSVYGSNYNKNLMIPSSLVTQFNVSTTNANNNAIFPFINKSTNNKQKASRTVFVLNILEHYRKYTRNGIVYNPRVETFDASKKAIYENITTLSQLDNSTLTPLFKKIVYENIDAIMTLINNGVAVPYIELGNEMSVRCVHATSFTCKAYDNLLALLLNINPTTTIMDNNNTVNYDNFIQGNGITLINNNATTIKPAQCVMPTTTIPASDVEKLFWWHVPVTVNITTFDPRTIYTLDCYAALCKMYINIIKNLRPNDGIRFGMYWAAPVNNTAASGWAYQYNAHVWCNYMINKKSYIGFDDIIGHPYFTGYLGHNHSALSLSGDDFFNTSLININNYFNSMNYTSPSFNYILNNKPLGSKIWTTEWEILASGASAFNNKIYNTFLDAFFYSEQLFNFIDANALASTKNINLIANKYLYNSSDFGYGLFQLKYNETNSFYKRAKYYAHKIMLPIINNTQGYKYVNAPNAGLANVPNGVKFRAFYKEPNLADTTDGGELLLYFYNTSGNSVCLSTSDVLDYVQIGNKWICPRTSNPPVYMMWADKLSASRGKTSFLNNETLTTNPSQTIQFNFSSTDNGESESANNYSSSSPSPCDDPNYSFNYPLEIPKYAIGYMRIPLRKNPWPCHINSRLSKPNTSNEEKQADVLNKFSIYPNPTKDNVYIEYAGSLNKNAKIQLFSINGQLMEDRNIEVSEGVNRYSISTSSLAKGTYVIKLINDQETKTEKIVVQ